MATQLSENAIKILERRYLLKDNNGNVIETPDEMFRRVAKAVAQGNKELEDKFYNLMSNLEFLPGSPTLMNAGMGNNGTLSSCFVLPIEDSMIEGEDSIMHSATNWAAVQKFGGGVGASFSRLRSKGYKIKTTHGKACGPLSVLKHYSSITDMITQGGKRDGANMGVMSVQHPDIIEFIKCKDIDKEIKNFNISVAITDKFMQAVKDDTEYELIEPSTNEVVKKIKARTVFDLIVQQAHKNGEPGIIFIDKMNKFNPTPEMGSYEAVNPCGEQVLMPYESCNLGSINLALMVDKNGEEVEIDKEKLERVVRLAVDFMDNVIDINCYPIKRIDEVTKGNRKIGLGVMGFADMLVQLGISYNSNDAVRVAEEVMSFIDKTAKQRSMELAVTKGSFPNFDKSIYKKKKKYMAGIRNATVTTIAPTGTIGLIADVTQGIEPMFRVAQKRRMGDVLNPDEVSQGKPPKYYYFTVVNKYFEKIARAKGFYNDELMEKIYAVDSIHNIKEIPSDIRKLFVSAYDVNIDWHIRIQSAFQKYVDNAISKTCNLSEDATTSDIYKAYFLAFDSECKGITVYRNNSRSDQVVSKVTEVDKKEVAKQRAKKSEARLQGYRDRINTGCGALYIHLYEDEAGLAEIFANMGQAGGCASCFLATLGRLISVGLRSGVEPEDFVKQLRGNKCPMETGVGKNKVMSCADGIGIIIANYLIEKGVMSEVPIDDLIKMANESSDESNGNKKITNGYTKQIGQCPKCGSPLDNISKCPLCCVCGWSQCGSI